jgi:hypothetical protein
MVGVLTMVALSAAAGPLYAAAVADQSLHRVLAAVPPGAEASDAPVLRLNGGIDPAGRQWADMLAGLDAVPGLGPPVVTVQSVSTELHPKVIYDPVGPVVTGSAGSAPVRLLGVEDPAGQLVVVDRMPGPADGVWLPEPVAAETGSRPGDEVKVRLSGLPDVPTALTRVVGTYAVQPDGRTPQSPPGGRLWSDLAAEGFPTDSEQSTVRAHLVVADVPATASLARRTQDEILWSARSSLEQPRPRLADFHGTAAAVRALRRDLAGRSDLAEGPVALRPSVASGLEDLATRADQLSAAARRGAAVTTRTGIGLALGLVVAAAGFAMGRRRREVRLAAGVGRRPISAGGLHAVELLPAAVLAGVAGWLAARTLVAATVGSSRPTAAVLESAAVWCAVSLLAALMASGGVAAGANRAETRRLEGRPQVRVPWVTVLVVLAASATAGLVSRPPSSGDALGPLDLLVPPLVTAAVAAVGSRLFFAALRRRRAASSPPTARTVTRWLAARRLRSPDAGREAATTIAATGLTMLVLALSSLASLERTVEDRAAVEVGAHTVDRVGTSWRLDPAGPVQADEPADGTPLAVDEVPAARNPSLPPGQSVVWRAHTAVASSEEGAQLLVVDPATLSGAAAWGSDGGPLSVGRALLPALAREDAAAAATIRRNGTASQVPALLVGTLGSLELEEGSTVTVDTLHSPVQVVVRGVLDAFPGTGTGAATLVVPADSFFATQLNEDPRLRPRAGAPSTRVIEFQANLWSSTAAGAAATLAEYGVTPEPIGTLAQARATPVYVAAEQARRYQMALGLVFGALGLSAVALFAVRLARRSPAADLMLARAGVGAHAPRWARALEVIVVLALTSALAAAAMLALRPLAGILLEPGDGRSPAASLAVPGAALVAGTLWLLATALVAVGGMVVATASSPAVEVLRGED